MEVTTKLIETFEFPKLKITMAEIEKMYLEGHKIIDYSTRMDSDNINKSKINFGDYITLKEFIKRRKNDR